MSTLTSGSAFSLMVRLADVCWTAGGDGKAAAVGSSHARQATVAQALAAGRQAAPPLSAH